ncbi:MAG: ORF6N domain-containing protein [Candidatus Omnitrophota bacterium]
MSGKTAVVTVIANKIFIVRGQKVILDHDLAQLYEVETKHLTRQVRRNKIRFPSDFMFQLTKDEYLRCQNGTSKRGGRRYLPYTFTEHGVAMLSSVLNSERAVLANIDIMRAFIKLREILSTHKNLARKLKDLEKKYDAQFQGVFNALRRLISEDEKPKTPIGFHSGK